MKTTKIITVVIAILFIFSACSAKEVATLTEDALQNAADEIVTAIGSEFQTADVTDDTTQFPQITPEAAAIIDAQISPEISADVDAAAAPSNTADDSFASLDGDYASLIASGTLNDAAQGSVILPLPDGGAIITSTTSHLMYRVSADGLTVKSYGIRGLPIATDGAVLLYIPMSASAELSPTENYVSYDNEVAYLSVDSGHRFYSVEFTPMSRRYENGICNVRLYDGCVYFECLEYVEKTGLDTAEWTSLYCLNLENRELQRLNTVNEEKTSLYGATVCNTLENAAIVSDGTIWCFDGKTLTHLTGYSRDIYDISQFQDVRNADADLSALFESISDMRLFGAVESNGALTLYYRVNDADKFLFALVPATFEYMCTEVYGESDVKINNSNVPTSLPTIIGEKIYYIAQWDNTEGISHSIHSVALDLSDRQLAIKLGSGKYATAVAQWSGALWYSTIESADSSDNITLHYYRAEFPSLLTNELSVLK